MKKPQHKLIDTRCMTAVERNAVKNTIEMDPHYEPVKWGTLTFAKHSPAAKDLNLAVGTFKRYCCEIVKKTKSHGYPLAAVDVQPESGFYHIHYVWCNERTTHRKRRKPTELMLRTLWRRGWKGVAGRGFIQENKTYDSSRGGVVYTLRHQYYIAVDAPFCRGRGQRCGTGSCGVEHLNFVDPVRSILGAKAKMVICKPSQK